MKSKSTGIYLFLAIVILISGCQPETVPSPLSARLSELSGMVDLKQAEQESFAPASLETTLEVNGQVQTGDDGRVRLDLSSGTIIRVAPSSSFTLLSNDEVEGGLATKIKLEFGKLFVILSGGSADVETPSGVASVRGSYMKVEVDPETLDIFITCLEGSCTASNPAGTVNFTNGQKVVLFHRDPVTGNWTAPAVESMTPEEFQEWLDNNPEARELFEQAMDTVTALAQPSPTEEPTSAPDAPPADAGSACFNILQPQSGAGLPKQGKTIFEWEEQAGAEMYLVVFIDQDGRRSVIETTENSIEPYIEVLPNGGQYSWFVTALGADGSEICSSSPVTFTKPKGDPTPKPTPEDKPERLPQATEETYCDPYSCTSSCVDPDYYSEFCYGN